MLERNENHLPDAPRGGGLVAWMIAMLAKWWRDLAISASSIAALGLIAWWILQVTAWASWTGFQGKTLWDLLELLVVPLALAIVAVWFNRSEKAQERRLAKEAREEERRIALDNQQERALQDYYADMKDLLLLHNLRQSEPDSEVRALSHAQTHAVLRRLDGERRGRVVQFLADAQLVNGTEPIIPLWGAILQGAYLRGVELGGAKLSRADLEGADLFGADLGKAHLGATKFSSAHLVEVNLEGAHLFMADLSRTDLRWANLSKADLGGAKLEGANLRKANLSKAKNIMSTNFDGADLTDAILDEGLELKDGKIVPRGG